MNIKEIDNLIDQETNRQRDGLVMIPSENLTSQKVLDTLSTPLNNKYSEGYPGKRYYTGNTYIDQIESIAIEQAKKLFGVEHANVQPHSGSNANLAVYNAILNPGDKILSMDLAHGGHLTHGAPINITGKLFDVVHYGVDSKTEMLDYAEIEKAAQREKPRLIISGASSYPREIDFEKINKIAHSVGAFHLADISHTAGLIAAGLHKGIGNIDIVTTTTHKTLKGPRGALILCKKEFAEKIDRSVFPGLQGGPFEHVIAAKAVNLIESQTKEFIEYQKQVLKNAKVLEKVFTENKLRLVTGGTDTHMLLIDVSEIPMDPGNNDSRKLNGDVAAKALEKALIYVNKNLIPFDKGSSLKPSGIRLGTPYLTARGMKEDQMKLIGKWISEILLNLENLDLVESTKNKVLELTKKHPVY